MALFWADLVLRPSIPTSHRLREKKFQRIERPPGSTTHPEQHAALASRRGRLNLTTMPSDRDLTHLYPEFREKVLSLLDDMAHYAAKHMIGYEWRVVEGFRTAKYQKSLYAQGRTRKGPVVTNADGYKNESKHQSSLAVDVVPFHGHDFDWTGKREWWQYLGHVARKHGLEWGGDWRSFVDKPHVQWPADDKATYTKAREWQKSQGLR